MNQIICIDIGGTAIKYGVLESDGTIFCSGETPTEAKKGGKALAGKVHDLCAKLIKDYPQAKGIAISSAGVVDTEQACIIHASDAIPGYKGISFRDELSEFNLPVEAENDVNSAGLSEYATGSAKGADSALILTIGTGIGGCFIEQGRLRHGHTYSACEVGYFPVDGDEFQNRASTTALVELAAAKKQEPKENWDGRKIFAQAAAGDQDCREAIEEISEILGKGIAALCFILNPEVVVLGGGIMAQDKVLRPLIEKAFAKHSIPLIADATRIEFASHQNAAGMKGALVHFLGCHPELA